MGWATREAAAAFLARTYVMCQRCCQGGGRSAARATARCAQYDFTAASRVLLSHSATSRAREDEREGDGIIGGASEAPSSVEGGECAGRAISAQAAAIRYALDWLLPANFDGIVLKVRDDNEWPPLHHSS